MSNDEFDKLKLNDNEAVKWNSLKKKKSCQWWSNNTSSQIFEQIEVIQRVVLTGISKLNYSVPEKKPGDQTQ